MTPRVSRCRPALLVDVAACASSAIARARADGRAFALSLLAALPDALLALWLKLLGQG
jgi:hypothetical protein